MQPPTEPPPAPSPSLASRLANVIAAPHDAFADLLTTPARAAHWLVPALLLALVGTVCGLLVLSQPAIAQQMKEVRDQAIHKKVAEGEIQSEQAAQAIATLDRLGPIMATAGTTIGSALDGFARPFIAAVILWLLATKLFKSPLPYLKAVEAAGLASIVLVLGRLANGLIALALGNVFMNASPILLVNPVDFSKPSHLLLASLDAFALWYVALLALALSHLAQVRFLPAATACLVAWILFVLLRSAPAILLA